MEFLTTKAFYPQRIAEKSERFLSSTFRQQVNRPIPQGFTPNFDFSHGLYVTFFLFRNPTIYCIHGNTFGIAKCCETLDGSRLSLDRDGALRAVGEDNATFEWDDSAISHSDTRPILGK